MSDYPEINDLDLMELRKKLKAQEVLIQQYEHLLKENGLIEKLTQMSDAEVICNSQIAMFKELSDKKIPFTIEDIKALEILVKTLMMARGKPIIEDKKQGKKTEKQDIGTLLKIAEGKDE